MNHFCYIRSKISKLNSIYFSTFFVHGKFGVPFYLISYYTVWYTKIRNIIRGHGGTMTSEISPGKSNNNVQFNTACESLNNPYLWSKKNNFILSKYSKSCFEKIRLSLIHNMQQIQDYNVQLLQISQITKLESQDLSINMLPNNNNKEKAIIIKYFKISLLLYLKSSTIFKRYIWYYVILIFSRKIQLR